MASPNLAKRVRVSPPNVSCITGQGKDSFVHFPTENFIHQWTVTDFRKKMGEFKWGEKIKSDTFQIEDTKWYLWMYPAGKATKDVGWVSVYLHQKSKKSVTVECDIVAGITEEGEFVVKDHWETVSYTHLTLPTKA